MQGFLRGTRTALYESGRESITVSLPSVTAGSVGALIALYERAVGFYASLVNINAYHQPGVEAGKKAASAVLALQQKVLGGLGETLSTAAEVAVRIQADAEAVYHVLEHLAANGSKVRCVRGEGPGTDRYATGGE